MKKKFLSILLVLTMVLTMMPMATGVAWAASKTDMVEYVNVFNPVAFGLDYTGRPQELIYAGISSADNFVGTSTDTCGTFYYAALKGSLYDEATKTYLSDYKDQIEQGYIFKRDLASFTSLLDSSLAFGGFSAEIPVATEAGFYSVLWYFEGDEKHNNYPMVSGEDIVVIEVLEMNNGNKSSPLIFPENYIANAVNNGEPIIVGNDYTYAEITSAEILKGGQPLVGNYDITYEFYTNIGTEQNPMLGEYLSEKPTVIGEYALVVSVEQSRYPYYLGGVNIPFAIENVSVAPSYDMEKYLEVLAEAERLQAEIYAKRAAESAETEEPIVGAPLTVAQAKALVTEMVPTVRTENQARGIKVVIQDSPAINRLKASGYKVLYDFYRAESQTVPKAEDYKITKVVNKEEPWYLNTAAQAGKKYYYKAIAKVYDKDGNLIEESELTQGKYGCRTRK